MDKRQITWLIVRAFGVYLLVQACILLPELLAGLFTARYYSNVMSSLGSESGNGGSYTRVASSMYRTLAVAPLLRIFLYSTIGIYMLRGGSFLVRLLQHVPDTSTESGLPPDVKPNLTERQAQEMTVMERLSASGLFQQFADAVERRDLIELERILRQIYLTPDDIHAVIEQMLGTSS